MATPRFSVMVFLILWEVFLFVETSGFHVTRHQPRRLFASYGGNNRKTVFNDQRNGTRYNSRRYLERRRKRSNSSCVFSKSSKKCYMTMIYTMLILCGDVELNPGPKHFCPACEMIVIAKHFAVLCDGCSSWYHIKCINMSESTYHTLTKVKYFDWYCNNCSYVTSTSTHTRKRKLRNMNFAKLHVQLSQPIATISTKCKKQRHVLQEHSYAHFPQEMEVDSVSLLIMIIYTYMYR